MSHYTVLIATQGMQTIESVLAPYSEELEVPEYEVDCYCIGRVAMDYASKAADRVKPLDQYRAEWRAYDGPMTWDEFRSGWTQMYEKILDDHPLNGKPDPDCESCNGTSKRMTTYNPLSKWDWFEVGGRWSDLLLLRDGTRADSALVKDIDFEGMRARAMEEAEATWDRLDSLLQRVGRSLREYIDARGGRARAVLADAETPKWRKEADQKLLSELLFWEIPEPGTTRERYAEEAGMRALTFAFIDLEGRWHARGEMGWWAIVSNAEPSFDEHYEGWLAQMRTEHPTARLTVCDLHI